VRNQGLLYRFSLNYADDNRKVLSTLKTSDEFVKYLENQNVLQKFIAFTGKQGVKEKPKDIRISGKLLKVQLDAYIARNFLDNDGFYPIIQEIDNTLEKAVETLK
jgi:carboxyl-terminal processing protease